MFREVRLPEGVAGRLLLHSMPGRYEALGTVWAQAKHETIGTIVCLAESDEIRQKSPEYAAAIAGGAIPCNLVSLGIADFGVPSDRFEFRCVVREVTAGLRTGRTILIHCAGGIGRTGMFATCVLLELGVSSSQAQLAIRNAGSHPENDRQRELVSWYSSQVAIQP